MPPSNWIPVSEGLPDDSGIVIVTDGRRVDVGAVAYYGPDYAYPEYRDTWNFDSILELPEIYKFEKITHWQPPPDPPEKEGA